MGVRQRRARAHSKTHIVAFAIAGFFASRTWEEVAATYNRR